jgi:large subunit ribosomal protein L21e
MPRSHGTRRKARSILTKDNVVRGISYLLHDYKIGEKVIVDVDQGSTTRLRTGDFTAE